MDAAHPSRFRPHPWHGLAVGPDPPRVVTAFIEITPFDLVKYETDKASGYLHVDRPQRSSSLPPTLYGFIPRTYCASRVAALNPDTSIADGDPLDICVISERPISRAEVLLDARVLGGLQMIDGGEADDKIVAVLASDTMWNEAEDMSELPPILVERLRHYFSTYKLRPGDRNAAHIENLYGRAQAEAVVRAAIEDYREAYGALDGGGAK